MSNCCFNRFFSPRLRPNGARFPRPTGFLLGLIQDLNSVLDSVTSHSHSDAGLKCIVDPLIERAFCEQTRKETRERKKCLAPSVSWNLSLQKVPSQCVDYKRRILFYRNKERQRRCATRNIKKEETVECFDAKNCWEFVTHNRARHSYLNGRRKTKILETVWCCFDTTDWMLLFFQSSIYVASEEKNAVMTKKIIARIIPVKENGRQLWVRTDDS